MRESVLLTSPEFPELELHSINSGDLENLREWKNAHRDAFFYKEIITAERQLTWYQGYLERADDYMFVIKQIGQPVGCIGFRYLNESIDIYNVMIGVPEMAGKGYMGAALRVMTAEASRRYPGTPLTLMVLKDNPALNWYKKNGFIVTEEHDAYFNLLYSPAQFTNTPPR